MHELGTRLQRAIHDRKDWGQRNMNRLTYDQFESQSWKERKKERKNDLNQIKHEGMGPKENQDIRFSETNGNLMEAEATIPGGIIEETEGTCNSRYSNLMRTSSLPPERTRQEYKPLPRQL